MDAVVPLWKPEDPDSECVPTSALLRLGHLGCFCCCPMSCKACWDGRCTLRHPAFCVGAQDLGAQVCVARTLTQGITSQSEGPLRSNKVKGIRFLACKKIPTFMLRH